jgi:4-diphosphocytidyl-2C-methyl-D-erythritol kinase
MNNLRNIPAPAKLNLFLHVVGQRDDGYHLLETFFDLVDWNDTLSFDLRTDGALVLANPLPGVPPQIDLCVQAAAQLAQYARSRERDVPGVTISVEKQLPIGGGIGGGSSDAATTLMALNRLWNLNLPRATLSRIGLSLGADVPVFIQGLPSWASGVGEKLEPAKHWNGLWYVILVPDTQVPTSAIFSAPELTRDTKSLRIAGSLFEDSLILQGMEVAPKLPKGKVLNTVMNKVLNKVHSASEADGKTDGRNQKIDSKTVGSKTVGSNTVEQEKLVSDRVATKFSMLQNDLQLVAVTRYPRVAASLASLKAGCAGLNVSHLVVPPRMTGSGACVFAGFASEDVALAVSEKVKIHEDPNTFVKVARSLKAHPLRDWSFST